uniref:Uncharacterized protein n=1 Tax=viral metagenome TaxID=1070528 RepID=A0A6C0E142_9ZZZZ
MYTCKEFFIQCFCIKNKIDFLILDSYILCR